MTNNQGADQKHRNSQQQDERRALITEAVSNTKTVESRAIITVTASNSETLACSGVLSNSYG